MPESRDEYFMRAAIDEALKSKKFLSEQLLFAMI